MIRDMGNNEELCKQQLLSTPEALDIVQNEQPLNTAAAKSHSAPLYLPHLPDIVSCQQEKTTTVPCDCVDEEDPLPYSASASTAEYIENHMQKNDDNIEDDSFSVTGSYYSEMYVFRGVTSESDTQSSSYTKSNAQNSEKSVTSSSDNETDEKEESPIINPNHPVVNNNTLASINGLVAVSDSESGGHHFHRRPVQFQKEYVPPFIRPLLAHMNDPSHFLPSSDFYNTPPYGDGHVGKHSACKGDERCPKISILERVDDTHTNHDPKKRNSSKRGERMSSKLRQVSPILSHPQRRVVQPQKGKRGLRKEVKTANLTTDHSPTAGHEHKDTATISQQLDLAIEATSGDKFFEVSTDWMKLTIAREEEVESSIL